MTIKIYRLFFLLLVAVASNNSCVMPLFLACQRGDIEAVHRLIKSSSSDLKVKSSYGESPLFIAAQNGHTEIVFLLIKEGALINVEDNDGNSPLFVASANGHLDIVRKLITCGANVNQVNNKGVSSLCIAAQNGYNHIVQLLLKKKDIDIYIRAKDLLNRTCLHQASQGGHLDIIVSLIKFGMPVDIVDDEGSTSLLIALSEGHVHIANTLVQLGATVNTTNNAGTTPLLLASQNGYCDFVELLLLKKVSLDEPAINFLNRTPLHQASEKGHLSIVEGLIQAGVNVNVLDDECSTPLSLALQFGNYEIAQSLRDAKAIQA